MPFGRKGSKLRGGDFLLLMATEAKERRLPYAERFQHMVMQALDPFDGEGMLTTELVAQRPLKEHEETPVRVILAAHQAARERGDVQARGEVMGLGLALLAKWPEYLLFGTDRHPTLEWKQAEDTSDAD
jgi:hypothetical protein